MSFSPDGLDRVSCQTTYICPVTGSIAAAGNPPVRIPGTSEPRNWPMVAGALPARQAPRGHAHQGGDGDGGYQR